ncbi:MAG: thioredoxin-like domain-containing protein [Fuerstiella sp.]|jgi:thiol-disulfide isomerase/thioredoxin|nr:thioredoxin-like domain-containing protein [Fuerstiella sp.]
MYRKLLLTTVVALAVTASIPSLQAAEDDSVSTTKTDILLKDGTWKDVEAVIAKHPGKIVIVDIWSTSCLPCMKEFPELVKLQKKYPRDLVCISFNIDYVGIKSKPPEYYRAKVEKFLQKREAEFPNFLCSVDSIEIFDQLDLNSIPAVLVFGRDGRLGKRFDDTLLKPGKQEAFTYQHDINPFVAALRKK